MRESNKPNTMAHLESLSLETLEEQLAIVTSILKRKGGLTPEKEEALWEKRGALLEELICRREAILS